MLILKRVAKKIVGLIICIFFFTNQIKATHIVGGDITVKWISGNDFEVTLTFYRDCAPTNTAYDPTITLGVYDTLTNALVQQFSMDIFVPTDTLPLGDKCNTPANLCVEKGIYRDTITLPDNPNGYYISWLRCCRNDIITNLQNPGAAGLTFYVKVPNPALHNSSPVFTSFPNAFMCINELNTRSFAASDADGDSLVYSLVTPLHGGSAAVPTPTPTAGPYSTVIWSGSLSAANIMGGNPHASIDSDTGILTATPGTLGVYVFSVRVEEFRNGIKIGEIRLDIQCPVVACKINEVPEFVPPTPFSINSYTLFTGDSLCFPVMISDIANKDTVMITVSSEIFDGGVNMPKAIFLPAKAKETVQSEFCIYANCSNKRDSPYHVTIEGQDTSCFPANKIFYDFDIYITTPKLMDIYPNVFTPNSDGKNDYFATNILNYPERNYCFDEFNVKIYDRWGNLVFDSNDFLFKWDGKRKGKEADDGVYYYIVTSKFQKTSTQEKGFVHLLR